MSRGKCRTQLGAYKMIVINHEEIGQRLKSRYSVNDIDNLLAFLDARGAFHFFPLPTGLYPAAGIDPKAASRSGYGNVWVRDHVYVALALRAAGRTKEASAAVEGLAAFFSKYRVRFEAIVEGRADGTSPISRPQVRFDGLSLLEIPVRWAHAQNDALGYFLRMYCLLAREGSLEPDGDLLALLVSYFEAIHYWEDEDSGHWEERRKIEASRIGTVVAGLKGLRELRANGPLPRKAGGEAVSFATLDALISRGEEALASILPAECIQSDPRKDRH